MRDTLACLAVLSVVLSTGRAAADPPCGAVEFRFKPAAYSLQIAIWIENKDVPGVIATPYITRATGQFGLGNRPGAALLKTDCGWPYGRREMVLPVWAHRRNHHYPKITMGGACGNSIDSHCPGGGLCAGNCDDSTVAYHGLVSSSEPYFCAPEGCAPGMRLPDVVSCASPVRTLSKGAYIDPTMMTAYSLYPPRADITRVDAQIDSADVNDFAVRNDLVAVSQATPRPNQPLDAPIYWNPENLREGDYVAYVEVSREADFNAFHTAKNHPNQDDSQMIWNGQGHPFLGQPSIVYAVPFHYDAVGGMTGTDTYAGYGAWDGQDGDLRPPDGTISVGQDGTGLGRLVLMPSGHRVDVVVGTCAAGPDGGATDGGLPHTACDAPPPPEAVAVTTNAAGTALDVSFRVPAGSKPTDYYTVRYAQGDTPITPSTFNDQLAGPSLSATLAGDTLTGSIDNIANDRNYQVAVRAFAACGTPSSLVSLSVHSGTRNFTTLHGCFVATAAWGSPLEHEVVRLRAFRDRTLLPSAAGRLAVAGYYAFGPSLAAVIASDGGLRALARRALMPVVGLCAALTGPAPAGP
jgi:hypothetical protein